ncbi:MAG: sulfotransferase [Snowella sp.]|nr:sulfotransferase [Snowella sp.]
MKKQYLFIGGIPRSGTTLVQRCLVAHSKIIGGPEFDHLPAIVNLYRSLKDGLITGRQSFFYTDQQARDSISNLIDELLQNPVAISDAEVIYLSEKTPSNLAVMSDLLDLFPNAQAIIVVRHPLDVLGSMWKVRNKYCEKGENPPSFLNSAVHTCEMMVKYWRFATNLYGNDRVTFIKYEELTNNPESVLKSIVKSIGLEYEDSVSNPPPIMTVDKQSNNHDCWITDKHNSKIVTSYSASELPSWWRYLAIRSLREIELIKTFGYSLEYKNSRLTILPWLVMHKIRTKILKDPNFFIHYFD